MKAPEEIYAACVTQHCTPDEYDGKVKEAFIAAIHAERERIAELESENQTLRHAQKAIDDCFSETMKRIAELEKALEPCLRKYYAAEQRASSSKARLDWFYAMPGDWPMEMETTMEVCRHAAELLKKGK